MIYLCSLGGIPQVLLLVILNQQGFRVFEQGSGQGLGNPETLDHLRILPHSKTELPDGKKRNQTLLEVS